MKTRLIAILGSVVLLWAIALSAKAMERGIYITSSTLENTKRINYLIKQAKASGINTFVIDYDGPNKAYTRNIPLVKEAGLKYVARIVVFPHGANPGQMTSQPYRDKKFNEIKEAIDLGANAIQLDYIRYSSKTVKPSEKNEQDVLATIKWYKEKINSYKLPMQIDVFGITSHHPEKRIGQYPKTFANYVDAINPMVYPSHYWPYQEYSAKPYQTVYNSLTALKTQLKDQKPVKINAYIEAHNYHYPKMGAAKKANYVAAQIKAVEDAKVDGWYFWSAHNHYDHLFNVLQSRQSQAGAGSKSPTVTANEKPKINSSGT